MHKIEQENSGIIALELKNISKHFEKFVAVNNLTLQVPKNIIFTLLGPNGAGKTTTINMICGLSEISEGSIHFPAYQGKDFKRLIGYCPQENVIYPKLTCLEQLEFVGCMHDIDSKSAKRRALELLEKMGLSEKKDTLASKLSGGMKRRLTICLALIHDPEILILDEPEAGLDPQSRILVREFILNFKNSKTIILTTHNMDEAERLSDIVAIMDSGKILTQGTPSFLKSNSLNQEYKTLEDVFISLTGRSLRDN